MSKKIYFTGGGSGGHIFPGIAVVESLIEEFGVSKSNIVWIGSGKGIEKDIVKRFGIKYFSVPAGKLRRYFSLRNFFDAFLVFFGFVKSFFKFLFDRPVVLFSKGGYVTVPPVVAARVLRIPILTHESDIVPGLATRINSKFVDKILLPYEFTKKRYFSKVADKCIVTGNPVRKEIFNGSKERALELLPNMKGKKVILVSGGSQGAVEINNIIYDNFEYLVKNFFVIHQTGKGSIGLEDNNYYSAEFIGDDFSDFLAAADIVISRAGAGTIWENGVTKTPAILVPLTKGSRGDQVLNAQLFADKNAAYVYSNIANEKNYLEKLLESIFVNEEELNIMGENALELCPPNASKNIAELVYGYIK